METAFQRALVNHCSPVLLGRKPSAMVSLPREMRREVLSVSRIDSGLRARVLCGRRSKDLVLIYRPWLLERYLSGRKVRRALQECGYPDCDAEAMLDTLASRIDCQGEFPHEVGFFLGYPADDVIGFIANKGREYKFSGPWKVYGSVGRAKSLFSEYRSCRECLMQYVEGGGCLEDLHPADMLITGRVAQEHDIDPERVLNMLV